VLAVVVIGAGLGFYMSGPSKKDAASTTSSTGSAAGLPVDATSSSAATSSTNASLEAVNFTRKGAPHILIEEIPPDQTSDKTKTDDKSSQSDADAQPSPDSSESNAPKDNSAAPATATSTDQPQPASSASANTVPVDPNANTAPATPPATATDAGSKPGVYRVVVSTLFSSMKNARIFASSLRRRGFMAVAQSSTSGSSYQVQVGAYRSKASAESTVSQLQQSGYPAYISQ
jgi:cell division septation protein DedD